MACLFFLTKALKQLALNMSSTQTHASKRKRYLISMFLEMLSPYKHVLPTFRKVKKIFPRLYSRVCFCCHYGASIFAESSKFFAQSLKFV